MMLHMFVLQKIFRLTLVYKKEFIEKYLKNNN